MILVVGARPNLMKAAALVDSHRTSCVPWQLEIVHTGQHYDDRLSQCFFEQLELPAPKINLGVESGTITAQTSKILERLEPLLCAVRPACVIVVGDVTSTLAAALTANRLGIGVAHVEAGLRSFDDSMPEETNRRLTDALSDILFVTEPSGIENLRREGITESRVHFVGNPMIDTLYRFAEAATELRTFEENGVTSGEYVLVTLHRPANVDTHRGLDRIVTMLQQLASSRDVLFPAHPRTVERLSSYGLLSRLHPVKVIDPQPYLQFVNLMMHSAAVLTDSGGVQEETTALGVPCVTLRRSTERPVTVERGTNVLVGDDPSAGLQATLDAVTKSRRRLPAPDNWDGHAGDRIVQILDRWLQARS